MAFFCHQPLIALKHTRLSEPVELELAMSRRIGWSQKAICTDPEGALCAAHSAAEVSDVVQLANQGFIFFKLDVPASAFEATCLSVPLAEAASVCGGMLRLVDATDSGALLLYPASGEASTKVDAVRWVFWGQQALRGIALKVLTEACRMHSIIGRYLISGASAHADEEMVQVLDVLLTKAVRLQGLLPGGIATTGSSFVRDVAHGQCMPGLGPKWQCICT